MESKVQYVNRMHEIVVRGESTYTYTLGQKRSYDIGSASFSFERTRPMANVPGPIDGWLVISRGF